MSKPCIVVYDDEMGLTVPYGFDPDCDGALSCDEPIAVFADRKTARKAIQISKKFAQLKIAQGEPENSDFTEAIKCIIIRDVELVGFTPADINTE